VKIRFFGDPGFSTWERCLLNVVLAAESRICFSCSDSVVICYCKSFSVRYNGSRMEGTVDLQHTSDYQ
jgi:hypothetical protein